MISSLSETDRSAPGLSMYSLKGCDSGDPFMLAVDGDTEPFLGCGRPEGDALLRVFRFRTPEFASVTDTAFIISRTKR